MGCGCIEDLTVFLKSNNIIGGVSLLAGVTALNNGKRQGLLHLVAFFWLTALSFCTKIQNKFIRCGRCENQILIQALQSQIKWELKLFTYFLPNCMLIKKTATSLKAKEKCSNLCKYPKLWKRSLQECYKLKLGQGVERLTRDIFLLS